MNKAAASISPQLSLAAFAREVNSRTTCEPPIRRSPEILGFALRRIVEGSGSLESRVLGRLLAAMCHDGGVTFQSSDIYALDGVTLGRAAELIEGRHNGWWPQPEWDDVRESIEAMASTAAHPGK